MRNGLSHSEAGKIGYEKSKDTCAAQKRDRIAKYEESPNICKKCGQSMKYNKRTNKFCDNSCATAYNNRGVRRHGKQPSNCLNCGVLLKFSNRRYCNNGCQKDHEWRKKSLLIEQGKVKELGAPATQDRNLKKYLIKKNGEKCTKCGWAEINPHTNTIPIQIDHIDGNPQNQSLSNVHLLCPNCHALTKYFGRRGKGRPWRNNK
jgi:predicted RNA-binding Zn-ribbon protein involved in translation (DUF1610 family)